MNIRPATSGYLDQWAALRIALWDWDTIEDHRDEALELYLSGKPDRAALVAVGFAETERVVFFKRALT